MEARQIKDYGRCVLGYTFSEVLVEPWFAASPFASYTKGCRLIAGDLWEANKNKFGRY